MFVAIRDFMLNYVPAEPFTSLRKLQVDSVDLGVDRDMRTPNFPGEDGKPFDLADQTGRATLRNRMAEEGLDVCCLSLATDFSREDQAAEVRWMRDACSAALDLDAPVVRVDPWVAEGRLTPVELARAAAESISEALHGTGEVLFGVENHGALANGAEFLDEVLGRIDSPRFGLTLDVGNLYWSGRPLSEVYELVERLAPHAVHTHVKNIAYPAEKRDVQREVGWEYDRYACPLADGDVDYRRVVQALEAAGYEGALAVEDESAGRFSPAEFREVLRRDVEYMLTILR